MANKYDGFSSQEFYDTLEGIVSEYSAQQLLSIPGIYEILAEHFNNDVLVRFDDLLELNDRLERGEQAL